MGQKRRVPINEVDKVMFLFGATLIQLVEEHGLWSMALLDPSSANLARISCVPWEGLQPDCWED